MFIIQLMTFNLAMKFGRANPAWVVCSSSWLGKELALGLLLLGIGAERMQALNLTNGIVISSPNSPISQSNAVRMLVEEVEKRALVRWPVMTSWPASQAPVIFVGTIGELETLEGPYRERFKAVANISLPEGYQISVDGGSEAKTNAVIFVVGNDARGVLFGVGHLLRELHMQQHKIALDDNLNRATAPKYALRGHQLGARPKCNSYDAWDLPVWEQYFRDLAVFGCNAIELIPPRSDDASTSPHFPRPPMEMMTGMSALANAYGLDVWIWYPAMDRDYSNPQTVEFALREWGEVFARLPRIDAVFVPGGDPGHTQPKFLMTLLEKQTENLHRYHPKAAMWVSPQSFNQTWLDEFIGILKEQQPKWLSGVVFGPQVRVGPAQLRELVPKQYPLRHYPDITHSRQCQYPVPEWDVAFAVTEARECINPRPEDEATIFRKTQPHTIGFLTYSEGCNDDVNKTVWSGLGWDPDAKVLDILRQYSRYFIGERYTEDFAQGLFALERNWRGSLATNASVDATLAKFQAMEKAASPAELKNWRFQQALFRAYYDAYTRHRLIYEMELETQALEKLNGILVSGNANASGAGSSSKMAALQAMSDAESILDRATNQVVKPEWRRRIFELGEALFQSISMQLSVEKYKAIAVDRGASLDTLEFPLNNRLWLKERFAKIRALPTESDRLAALREIAQWTEPGPGGFYDDLGNIARQPHLVTGPGFEGDPDALEFPRIDFEEDLVLDEPADGAGLPRRMSWMDHAEALYDAPLRLRYTGLDSAARYKLRAIYGGDNPRRKLRLTAGKNIEIHPYMARPIPFKPVEFAIPSSAIENGELTLSWQGEVGLGGNGRGCQVSEVWLVKEGAK